MTEVKYFHSALVLTNLNVDQELCKSLRTRDRFRIGFPMRGKRVSKST
jgi:hypothetical protein